ncbi:hypothetical protein EDB86DRAFT_2890574 [Lactarius hatsudake]|nr:hypothetical protein EDB86DRAFT_2890574 [Lactarius hatsudake]
MRRGTGLVKLSRGLTKYLLLLGSVPLTLSLQGCHLKENKNARHYLPWTRARTLSTQTTTHTQLRPARPSNEFIRHRVS